MVRRRVAVLVIFAVFRGLPVAAQVRGVGSISFDNSGSRAAQEPFLTGVAQLHNFEYQDAAKWFQQTQKADPAFALAYWGEAMTFNHPVWMEQDLAAARRVLARLGPTREDRIVKGRTDREKAYLRAIEALYGNGDKYTRDDAYAEAMADLRRDYPEDVDATAFYALALLGTSHEGRDVATYMRAAALLEPLFPTHPYHPGIAHYLIHAYDDPIHAPLGMRAARAYSTIAPSAAHAQHMCSHIFLAMGMWDDVVRANEVALAIVASNRSTREPPACGHGLSWLQYGYLQQGRVVAAKELLARCRAVVRANGKPINPEKLAIDSFVTMRARYLLDTDDWASDVVDSGVPLAEQYDSQVLTAYIDGYAAIKKSSNARPALARLQVARAALDWHLAAHPPADGSARSARAWAHVLELQLRALILVADGDRDAAVAQLREAAAAEDAIPYEFGPPFIDKPTYELLGEVLLDANRLSEARVAFEQALKRAPRRSASLLGLLRATQKLGERERAEAIKAQLREIWHHADRSPIDFR
jgi:tetratricopeptide (TPR) repeat protein